MAACKLILTDIDGTILPYGQPQLGEEALDAIHAAQDAGITFGPCSGRSTAWIGPLFRDDPRATATCVATNGLEVRLDGRVLRHTEFDRDVLQGLVDYASRIPHAGVLCFEGHTPYLACGTRDDLLVAFERYGRICVESDGLPDGVIDKCNAFVVGDLAATQKFVADLNQNVAGLDFDVPEPGFSNVMPEGVNKATGIDVLVDALGISLDEVVVFGDGGNDVPMLEHVPNSVAVSGAQPVATAAARWHVGACEDGAVPQAIAALARGEWPFTH